MIIGSQKDSPDVRVWTSKLAILQRQVCLIDLGGTWLSTGFLVGPDVVLTTFHSMQPLLGKLEVEELSRTPDVQSDDVTIRFDYILSEDGQQVNRGREFRLAQTDWLVDQSPVGKYVDARHYLPDPRELDYALLRISDSPGLLSTDCDELPRGWIELANPSQNIEVGSSLTILQYPGGSPLRISIDTHAVTGFNENQTRVLYTTYTLPGSSGAPCFDINWRLTAMHQGTDNLRRNNQGIPIHLILKLLKERGLSDVVSQASPRRPSIGRTLEQTLEGTGQSAPDPALRAMINEGESQHVEFKETACRNLRTGVREKKASNQIVKSVAGFMNSEDGGTLLIGIADDGEIIGLNDDYLLADPSKRNFDGYSLFLDNLLSSNLSIENSFRYYKIARHTLLGRDICRVDVEPTSKPVYVEKRLYVRVGNKCPELRGPDMLDYVVRRWR